MDPSQDKVPTFKKATIHEIFRQVWSIDRLSSIVAVSEPPPKINDLALHLSAEYIRLFTIEALHRSNQFAQEESQAEANSVNQSDLGIHHDYEMGALIEVKHLQKIAPGLLLDF